MTAWGPQPQLTGYIGGRVWRAAPLVVSSNWTHLAFDSFSTQITAFGVTLVGGDIVSSFSGSAMLAVNVVTDPEALVGGVQVRVVRDPASENLVVGVSETSGGAGSAQVVHIDAWFDILAGKPIRVEIAVSGNGNANLLLDESQVNATIDIRPPNVV